MHEGVSEVELSFAGRVGIGRSGSGALIGGAEATLTALREIGYEVPFFLVAVNSIATVRGWPVIVTLRSLSDEGDRIGIAQSNGDLESAARATLDALNRYLSTSSRPRPRASRGPAAHRPCLEPSAEGHEVGRRPATR